MTLSLLRRCSDGRDDELYYVVKFQDNLQHCRVLVNELLGTRLAARIGLPTPPVALVEVGEDLIQVTPCAHDEIAEVAHPLPRRGAIWVQ